MQVNYFHPTPKSSEEKSIIMMAISIIGGIVLIIGSFITLIMFVHYGPKSDNSVFWNIFQYGYYVTLGATVLYGFLAYFLANFEYTVYNVLKSPIVITGFVVVGLHACIIVGAILFVISKLNYKNLLLCTILPSVLESAIIGLCIYSTSNLFKKVAYFLIPVINPIINY